MNVQNMPFASEDPRLRSMPSVVQSNYSGIHSVPTYVNQINTAMLRLLSSNADLSISVTMHPMPRESYLLASKCFSLNRGEWETVALPDAFICSTAFSQLFFGTLRVTAEGIVVNEPLNSPTLLESQAESLPNLCSTVLFVGKNRE